MGKGFTMCVYIYIIQDIFYGRICRICNGPVSDAVCKMFTASRGTPCGASAMAPMRGEKTSSVSSQAGSGLDLRMIWLIFPIKSNKQLVKSGKKLGTCQESCGADVLDFFFPVVPANRSGFSINTLSLNHGKWGEQW